MDWIQLALFLTILLVFVKPLGLFIVRILDPNAKTFLDPLLKPIERGIYRSAKIDPTQEQGWKEYLICIMGFSLVSLLFVFIGLGLQEYLPFNPQKIKPPAWHLNLNTSISFMTNTNWQSYGGESTMSYFSQMAVLTVQNFVSAAVGLSAAAALIRGISAQETNAIGNFWADLVRISLYLLLPICIGTATLFIAEGVPQNFHPYAQAQTLEGRIQNIAQGPIASQEAIKLLGTNGGGFTNANSAHPYENPTPLSNFLQLILILLIPTAQIYSFGVFAKNIKHGWAIFTSLAILFILGVWICSHYESVGNPQMHQLGIFGSNWEGKEQRFGIFGSTLYACVTTAVSCGSVNCMHDSFTPLGGFIPMLNIQLSEVVFGGVGAGLYSVLLFVLLAIFIAGLIIGRTPEYLGKKIEPFDIQMTMLAILPFVLLIHGFTALACCTEWGVNGVHNAGPHGFSEILYAFSSCTANNGSAFSGLSTNTVPYNLSLAAAAFFGRFLVLGPVIALAGSFAKKKINPNGAGSFPVSSPLFIALVIGVILLLGALIFFPTLTMGPIVEQFFMHKGELSE